MMGNGLMVLLPWGLTSGSNWAQTTGPQLQTTTIPYVPSHQRPHWSGRFGHALAASNVTDDGEKIFGEESYLYLIGGDDYGSSSLFNEDNPSKGMKNDVWRLKSADRETWVVKPDMIDRTPYDHEFPEQHATVRWELVSQGHIPRVGQTYEDYIQCQPNYPLPQRTKECSWSLTDDEDRIEKWTTERGWFSQRRHHQVVIYKKRMYVIGGRAREHLEFPHERGVGGIIGPRPLQEVYSTWREATVLKNDVWMSNDWGETWRLIQPGCKSNQRELLLRDDTSNNFAEMFNPSLRCDLDSDCYGNQEVCVDHVCVCELWSPREQHRVAVFGDYMYLVGGFASSHQSYCDGRACGDLDASGYREYMNDVWFSRLADAGQNAGGLWTPLTTGAEFSGRGGHSLTVARLLDSGSFALYVLGGETGDTVDRTQSRTLNDVWYAPLPRNIGEDPVAVFISGWTLAFESAEWAPRTGHVTVVDPPSAINGFTQRMYVIGGKDAFDEIFGDVWSWGWECHANDDGLYYNEGECSSDTGGGRLKNGTRWRKDYTVDGFFRFDSGSHFIYDAGQPQRFYVDGDSPVEDLAKVYLPLSHKARTYADEYDMPSRFIEDQGSYGTVPRRQQVIEDDKIDMLHKVGIFTVRDLAEADREAILKLRGYPDDMFGDLTYDDVCDHRQLAIDLLRKCTVQTRLNPLTHYDSEAEMPWNIKPKFKGGSPVGPSENYWKARWYGRYFNQSEGKSDEDQIKDWDGCASFGMDPVNVPGIGDVPPSREIRNSWREIQELVCKANPGPRAYFAGVYFDQKIYVMGGLVNTKPNFTETIADMWYRDDYLPRARIVKKPKTLDFNDAGAIFHKPEFKFKARPDKEGTILEHLLLDADEHDIVRTWDRTRSKARVKWLDYWFKGGPGSGNYIFYVRSLDPAGNIDISYSRSNLYKWKYNTALPWHIIGGTIGGFIGLCILIWLEKKRRRRKAAMERYAIKRMRRKFKKAQGDAGNDKKGAVDWKVRFSFFSA